MNHVRILAGLVLGALGAGGCVDLSPVAYEAPEAGAMDAGPVVALDGASFEAEVEDCTACLSAGPCASWWTECQGNTVCAKFADCMSPLLCWSASLADLSNLSPCLIQCATAAGVTSQSDPAAIIIAPLVTCAQDPARCGHKCVPGADF